MDAGSIQAHGKDAFWPLFEVWDQLAEWVDIHQLEQDYDEIMKSKADSRPLRRLQAIQTIAPRFLKSKIAGVKAT